MVKEKNVLRYSALILVGAILGGIIVWAYYGSNKSQKEPIASITTLPQTNQLSESEKNAICSAYLESKKTKNPLFASGAPEYGGKLGVSYDQAAKAVNVLAGLESKISFGDLTASEKERYIKIGTTPGTACEYCCGAKTMAREDGQRACGCKHDIAFSGLTMWMLKNGYKDKEILKEIAKWKALFFPKQALSKEIQEMEKAGDPQAKEILKEFPGFLPSMVGGC